MIDQILIVMGITFLVMVSPGPDMIIVMRNTIIAGRSAGTQTSLGVLAGNLVHISYCVVGIGWLISQSILAFSLVKYAGAAYLIYLGIVSFRSSGTTLDVRNANSQPSGRTWFLQGFINNILNPKGTLFYLGVFTMVITPKTTAAMTLVLIACMMLVSASFWLFFVYTLDRPIIRGSIERFQQAVSKAFGVLLMSLGLRVALMDR
ncbi:resistance to homoserine/threonine (RhtB) family protein [Modicisalibacter ilicicola DSM 19980]|uniref:Resistance to homoserine/threonine (RhtB) family protein n=1 Tax=Modicisalibacter ilicicola DSM 19980 TaxID=1121942 RepID=A0A1M5A1Q5_9GAMM|nr:LysE family translocator [Halomonas ilicicola]SHF24218.1 resistance to homoserine/threonine (RhtB) family protein [Halomonas ilicicola DSM 19980]